MSNGTKLVIRVSADAAIKRIDTSNDRAFCSLIVPMAPLPCEMRLFLLDQFL
jgi:hypothetical protein